MIIWSLRQTEAEGIHWRHEKECDVANADRWLNMFSMEEPEIRFVASETMPPKEKRMPSKQLYFFPSSKRDVYYFTVEGFGEFPHDMLRYDECWPVHGEDVLSIVARYQLADEENHLNRRKVRMGTVKRGGPTVGRWESFNWRVHEEPVPDQDTNVA